MQISNSNPDLTEADLHFLKQKKKNKNVPVQKKEEKKKITQTEKESLVLTQLGLSYIQKKKTRTHHTHISSLTNDISVILNQFQKVFEDFFLYMGTTSFVTSNFLIQTKKSSFNKPNHEDLYV